MKEGYSLSLQTCSKFQSQALQPLDVHVGAEESLPIKQTKVLHLHPDHPHRLDISAQLIHKSKIVNSLGENEIRSVTCAVHELTNFW